MLKGLFELSLGNQTLKLNFNNPMLTYDTLVHIIGFTDEVVFDFVVYNIRAALFGPIWAGQKLAFWGYFCQKKYSNGIYHTLFLGYFYQIILKSVFLFVKYFYP